MPLNDVNRQNLKIIIIILLDFIDRGSLFSIFTTLFYHKVLINNKTEQDTNRDKQLSDNRSYYWPVNESLYCNFEYSLHKSK